MRKNLPNKCFVAYYGRNHCGENTVNMNIFNSYLLWLEHATIHKSECIWNDSLNTENVLDYMECCANLWNLCAKLIKYPDALSHPNKGAIYIYIHICTYL